jgi:NAD(P)H dehydrogenase (quinone)
MKIGVTGATGQLGRLVIKYLKEITSADQIVALVRSPKKAADFGVEVRSFDYSKPENMVVALKGIDKLLLISGSEVGKRLEQHTHVIEAAQKAGVKFIAYTSLLRADKSTLVLAGEHLETEKVLKNAGIPFTILRNSWYTENYTGSISQVISSEVLLGSSGYGKISSATRADYAKAAVKILTTEGHEGKTYELAGDKAFTMADMAAEIARQTGKKIVYKNLPVEEYIDALVKTGMPEGYARFFAGTHVATEKGDLFDDGCQLSKLIGRPTTSLAQVIADVLAGPK